jgi:S1-C subfamily serine protease
MFNYYRFVFKAIFLLIISLGAESQLQAKDNQKNNQKHDSSHYRSSILLLRSASEDVCGSGVLLKNGDILTADHLIRDLCPANFCDNLTIEREVGGKDGKDERELITGLRYSVKTSLSSFDIALLTPNTSSSQDVSLKGHFSLGSEPPLTATVFAEVFNKSTPSQEKVINAEQRVGQEVTALSYVGCEELKVSKGEITANDPVFYSTTALGDYGSSGGALIDREGKLLGIVTEAASNWQMVKGKLFNSSFYIKAAGVLPSILHNTTEESSLINEARVIIDFYNYKIKNLNKAADRKWYDLELFKLIGGFRRRILASDEPTELLKPLLASEGYLSEVVSLLIDRPAPPNKLLFHLADELALINSFEKNGPNSSFFKKIDALTSSDVLKSYGYPLRAEQLQRFAKTEHLGANLLWTAFYLYTALLVFIFLVAYAFSLGYVWGKERTPLFKRVLIVLVVGLLGWPLSLLAYQLRVYRVKKASVNEK